MRITGRVLDVDKSTQTSDGPSGPETYTVTTVFVLDGRDVTQVRLARNFPGGEPAIGEDVDFLVGVRPWVGRTGVPQFTVTAWRPYDPASLALVASA